MAITFRERLASLVTRAMSPENPSTPLSAVAKWLGAGTQTVAGELINEQVAMKITTVRTCVTVLAESVASLPCLLFERTDRGQMQADNQTLFYILRDQPNDEMSAFTFWESMVGGNALTGNSYAEIAWTKSKTVGELYPLNPLMTEPYRKPDGQLGYRTRQGVKDEAPTIGSGTGQAKLENVNTHWRYIESANILHFRLFSLDGLKGFSPITLAREALGLTRATEKFGAKFFGNGSRPGGVLSSKNPDLDETQLDDNRRAWEAAQGGSNQGRTAVLSGEWEYKQIGLSPEDSQFLLTRAFQRAEIAAMFRVPAHMAGDTSKISNSSYEQMTLSFVSDTLRPILTRIESELNRKLLPDMGRKANKFFVKFDLSERLRSDHETTVKGIALGRQWGLTTVDEGRVLLGLNPIGDSSRLVPVNMMNADLIPDQEFIPGNSPGLAPDGSDMTDPNDPDNDVPGVSQPVKAKKPSKTVLTPDPEDEPNAETGE